MIPADRAATLLDTTNILLDARRTAQPIADLPLELQPQSLEEAYYVQDQVALAYEEVGGYKIGAPTPDATPIFAPMPRIWIAPSAAIITTSRYRGIEAEIAFLLGKDLPPRETPYTREEVIDAVASCHPVIEILESALTDPFSAARFSMIADLQVNGGLIYGPAVANWQSIDFTMESVTVAVDGSIRAERTGSNTSGDFLRLLPFLANEGAARTGGLRAGQWITTGSWTGYTLGGPNSDVDVNFASAGRVTCRFSTT